MPSDPLIFVSAGEASGDAYGADLVHRLRSRLPSADFVGLGGVGMERAGQRRVVRAEDVAFMGITEILRHVPRVLGSYGRLVRCLHRERPHAAVFIDFPDVNFRLARHCRRLGIPVIWFVSPQLWAWKRKRLRWVQERVSQMLTIFPFEEDFYRNRGVRATFVGHPLAVAPAPTITREQYAEQWRQSPAKPWIALLPGSRRGEVEANLPALLQSAAQLGPDWEYLVPVAPTLEARWMKSFADTQVRADVRFVENARAALFHSRAAVVASGTATVQAAILGIPFVTVYRVSTTTFRAAKRLVRYPPEIHAEADAFGNLPVAMPNLIAGRRVTHELLQDQFTPKDVIACLQPLLRDGSEREKAILGLAEERKALLPPDSIDPIDKVCNAVLQELLSHA